MNTHDIDIELPPLPEWVDWPVTVSEMSASEVKEAMQDYALAAIEADRKRRGEPVAWRVHPFDYGVGYEGVYALTSRPDQVAAWERKGWEVQPLFSAPQPAEPSHINLLSEAKKFLDSYEDQGPYGEGWKSSELESLIEKIDAAIKAQSAEPSGSEPVAWLRSDQLRKLGRPYSDSPVNQRTDSMLLSAKGTPEAAEQYGHDVPVYAAPQPAEPVKVPGDELQGLADRAYCQYIDQLRRSECLGWEQKVKDRRFGETELRAHTKAGEFLGRHRAFSEAAALLARYRNSDIDQLAQPAASEEPVLRIYAEGSMRVVTEWMDGALDLPDGDHDLYAAPVAASAESVEYPLDEWVEAFFGEPDEHGFYNFRGDFGNVVYRYQAAMKRANKAASPDQQKPHLYQHTDGRYGLSFGPAKFAKGEPAWYSVPIDVYEDDGR